MAGKGGIGGVIKKLVAGEKLTDRQVGRLRKHVDGGGNINPKHLEKVNSVLGVNSATNAAVKGQAAATGGAATSTVTGPAGPNRYHGPFSQMDAVQGPQQAIKQVDGLFNKSKVVGQAGWSNLKGSFGGDGMDAAWGMAKIGMRGAVVGGAAGGTLEAAQGGSFWTGAKEGAFNGAIGWGAYRGLKRAYGDGGGFGSTARGLGQHIKAVGKKDPNVSNSVYKIADMKQHANLAKAANNLK